MQAWLCPRLIAAFGITDASIVGFPLRAAELNLLLSLLPRFSRYIGRQKTIRKLSKDNSKIGKRQRFHAAESRVMLASARPMVACKARTMPRQGKGRMRSNVFINFKKITNMANLKLKIKKAKMVRKIEGSNVTGFYGRSYHL